MQQELRCAICGWPLNPEPDGIDVVELGGESAMDNPTGSVHLVVRTCNECWIRVKALLSADE